MKPSASRETIEQLRHDLLDSGYQPIAVYAPEKGGKRPVEVRWQNATGLPPWNAKATNTGLLARGLRVIDIDVDDRETAAAIIALAQDQLGPAPIRTRSNSGRAALVYRAAEGEPRKRIVALGDLGQVEVQGNGQQFVAYGTHATGVPLEWRDASPLDTPREDLTAVTEAQLDRLLDTIFEHFATPAAKAARARQGGEEAWEAPTPAKPVRRARSGSRDRAWAEARLAGEMRELAQTTANRNDRLNKAVFQCAQLVPHGLLTTTEIAAAAEEACWANGHVMDEKNGGMAGVRKTIASGMADGEAEPYDMEKVEARRQTRPARPRVVKGGPSAPPPHVEPVQAAPPDEDILNARALENLDLWLPTLVRAAERRDDGSYLITADRAGEVFDEPLVATPQGISGSSPIAFLERFYPDRVRVPRVRLVKALAACLKPSAPSAPPPDGAPARGATQTAYAGPEDGEPSLPSAADAWNAFVRPPVPVFPLEALPDTVRAYVQDRASVSGADVNAFAMASLATLSGVIDHRVKLKPKKYADDLTISPNLWVMIIAPPSTRKTAVMRDVYDAIDRLDARDLKAYQEAKAAAEARAEAAEEARAKEAKSDVKKIPPARHRILTDATSERLCDLLSHQDCGAILVKDELSGWIGAMDKYGGGGKGAAQDRSIWVRAFDGGPYTQHRLTTVDRRVKNLSVAIIGSIQPERLAEMGRLDTDGLIQRFLPVMMDEARPYRDEPRDIAVEHRFTALIDGLDRVLPGPFLLTDEGRAGFARFMDDMTRAGKMTDPSPALGGFLAKLPRTLGAIALMLHLVDVAEGRWGLTADVSDDALARAERIVREFVIPHAQAFYDAQTGGQAFSRTRQIAAAIIKHDEPTITVRDLFRTTRALRVEREEVRKLCRGGGWLTPVEPGPWNTEWHITPGLRERFADEHEAEVRLQAEIRARIGGGRP